MTDADEHRQQSPPRISIAMATYNGERFLQGQLDSIASQNLLPYELVATDDRSSDSTIAILERFAKVAPFPVRIYRNEVNLGFGDNFFRAASECRGDWIAFCDQDDVWLPNKLSDVAGVIAKTADLAMVLQKAKFCNEALEWGGRMFPDSIRAGAYPPRSQNLFWVWFGFLLTIPRELLSLKTGDLPMNYCRSDRPMPHDGWACTIANAVGRIVVLDQPSALYRRHDAAVTGYHQNPSIADTLKLAGETGAEHYDYMADAAVSNSGYLHRVGKSCARDDWAGRLLAVAGDFDRMASIQRYRANLYRQPLLAQRLRSYASIWSAGGYVGPAVVAMGVKSAAKDVVQMLSGRWSARG